MVMANNIKKPASAKSRKGAPPKLEEAPTNADRNLSKAPPQALISMNFKVPAEFVKEFKQVALDENKKLVDLLKDMFEEYKGGKN